MTQLMGGDQDTNCFLLKEMLNNVQKREDLSVVMSNLCLLKHLFIHNVLEQHIGRTPCIASGLN